MIHKTSVQQTAAHVDILCDYEAAWILLAVAGPRGMTAINMSRDQAIDLARDLLGAAQVREFMIDRGPRYGIQK